MSNLRSTSSSFVFLGLPFQAKAICDPSGEKLGDLCSPGKAVNGITLNSASSFLGDAMLSRRGRYRTIIRQTSPAKMQTLITCQGQGRLFTTASRDGLAPAIGGVHSTGAMNVYPLRGMVSMKVGLSAESPRVSRRRLTAVFKPVSKSTKVFSCHRSERNSSRLTSSPGYSSNWTNTWRG